MSALPPPGRPGAPAPAAGACPQTLTVAHLQCPARDKARAPRVLVAICRMVLAGGSAYCASHNHITSHALRAPCRLGSAPYTLSLAFLPAHGRCHGAVSACCFPLYIALVMHGLAVVDGGAPREIMIIQS